VSLRAVFHDENDAWSVAARLQRDGFDAVVEQDRFAGEDDDEEHPWAVLTDAPDYVLDLMVEEHDGWLDHDSPDDQGLPSAPPMELPLAPRRIKGHWPED
jgi:8-oxo-dGTP diphosphatase